MIPDSTSSKELADTAPCEVFSDVDEESKLFESDEERDDRGLHPSSKVTDPNKEKQVEASLYPSSLETPLPSTNVGFQLLKKFGWTEGTGIGRTPGRCF
jgi:hypothetical protein